jgi:hypothetical protein
MPRPLLEVAEHDRRLARVLGLLQRRLELVERRRRSRDLVLVVEDAHDLAGLREAVEVAGAEVLTVGPRTS